MKTLAALLLAAAIWAVGLVTFADRVERSTPARLPTKAQGVVALTGIGSNERIGAGVVLLERGLAKRMLVSGVNREVSREDIRKVSKAARRIYDCCIDLGFTAADTVGNARETAEWARATTCPGPCLNFDPPCLRQGSRPIRWRRRSSTPTAGGAVRNRLA